MNFVVLAAWRRVIQPRRDRGPRHTFKIDQAAVLVAERLVARNRPVIERVLGSSHTDPALAEQARAHLAGEASPGGAAVIATVLSPEGEMGAFAHEWIARHGVAWAARATAELAGLYLTWGHRGLDHVRRRRENDMLHSDWTGAPLAVRVRSALAAAPDEEYAAAVRELDGCRAGPFQQLVSCFLVPTELDWVDEFCATAKHRGQVGQSWWMGLCAVSTERQLRTLCRAETFLSATSAYTVAEAVGPAIAPVLASILDRPYTSNEERKVLVSVLSVLPTDEAFSILLARLGQKYVQPALITAMKSEPLRALRLLAPAAQDPVVAQLLSGHLLANPGLLDAELPEDVRATAETLGERVAEAPQEALPELLVRPPWTARRPRAAPPVISGPVALAPPEMAWLPGEREAWAETSGGRCRILTDWASDARDLRAHGLLPDRAEALFAKGPKHLVRALLEDWRPKYHWDVAAWARLAVARFELEALPFVLDVAAANPASAGELVAPYIDVRVAHLMADWMVRLKSGRAFAVAWFTRHAAAAAGLLVPAALGKPGPERHNALAALRFLASLGHDVRLAAGPYGADAVAAVDTQLTQDPLLNLPARIPVPGDWADPALLPQILMRDREHALPLVATGHVVKMLAMSRPGDVYAGVDVLKEIVDPVSLAEFAWALFQRWQAAGTPAKENWALSALGWLGDDETVRRLSPLIRAWPYDGGHTRAVLGLDVLAAIGTDVALGHLSTIAEKAPSSGLKRKAQEKIAAVAAELGLSAEQLSDRLVPSLGLDDPATLLIDYGSRRFVVGFDGQLKPYVEDEDGNRRKDLPKPGARDDQELAPAEYKRFTALKKDVRAVAADQIRRLETAMVRQRQWSAAEFRSLFAEHPLLSHLARRLVWQTTEGQTFRLTGDHSLAEDSHVRIAHPLHLTDKDAWAKAFAGISQPFPQLARPVHELGDDERSATRLFRFENLTVPVGRLLGLTKRGWERGVPQDNGTEYWITQPVTGGGAIVINLDPGITVGAVDNFPEQTLTAIWLASGPDYWRPHGSPPLRLPAPDHDVRTPSRPDRADHLVVPSFMKGGGDQVPTEAREGGCGWTSRAQNSKNASCSGPICCT